MVVDFSENHLPAGQPLIETKNLVRFNGFVKMVLDSRRRYPAIGTVTGAPGSGKTIAVQSFVNSLPPRRHSALPLGVAIKVASRSTGRALATDIARALDEKPRGRNVYEVADEAALSIQRNDLQLLVIDEADRLTEDTFDVVRHIFDKSGCNIIVVGLPKILSVIESQDKFASRVALRMKFEPLDREEIVYKVLPQMVFPHWGFSPDLEEHLVMGDRIYAMVGSSLRKIRNLLQAASQVAELQNKPTITLPVIEEAFQWSGSEVDRKRMKSKTKAPKPTSYEAESQMRQDAKKK